MKSLFRSRSMALASVAIAVPLWSACSSTTSAAKGAAAAAPAALCQKLNAIFSDGPDPDADPVGYALSQIKSLGTVHTADHAVSAAVTKLLAADQSEVSSDGRAHAAKAAIKQADTALNASCPGVAS